MGRAAFTKTKILMLREAKRVERPLSKIAGADREINKKCKSNDDIKSSSSWVPHPKSGIYFPKGHEWVMDDVPDRAALSVQVSGFEASTVLINRSLRFMMTTIP
ncbi:hypothetical protein V6Z12_A13G050300, partial [Gossypium hirsutum]